MERVYIIICFIAYLTGTAYGVFEVPEEDKSYLCIKKKKEKVLFPAPYDNFKQIAYNNIKSEAYCMFLGIFSIGILSMLYAFYNGFLLGCAIAHYKKMLTFYEILHSTLPHSSEIIAIVISCYAGYMLSNSLLLQKKISYKKIAYAIILCIVITVISAALESYVSMSPIR